MTRFSPRTVAFLASTLPALAFAAPITLSQALDLAVQRSESTHSALAGVASASEAARAAGQLPDPTLRLGVDNLPVTGGDRFSTTRDNMTMKRIGIGQEWVSADKRAARQAAADAMVGRESIGARTTEAEVRLQTALAYIDAFFTAEALRLATLSEHHVHEELEAARARLASSIGGSADVLAATSARGIAEDASAEVRQQESTARIALARWTGQRADELAPPTELPDAPARSFVVDHPMVLAARQDVLVARREADVAATNRNPSWSWEVSYGQRTGYSDMVSVGVTIPLPVSRAERQDRETASKLALVDKAEAALQETMRAAEAEFGGLASDAERLTERLQRYETSVAVPAAQRTAAALAAYRSNQGTLVALFEARHMEVEAQQKLLGLRRELARVRAELAFRPVQERSAP